MTVGSTIITMLIIFFIIWFGCLYFFRKCQKDESRALDEQTRMQRVRELQEQRAR